MKKQIIVLTSIFIVSSTSVLFAQEDNGQAGGFLRYGVGGRALGMGRAFTAVANDASGVYWNPAGILGVKRFEVTSMYTNLYYDSQFANFGLVIPRPILETDNAFLRFLFGPSTSLGISWVGLSMVGFEQRTEFCEYLGDFGLSENAFLFSWAKEYTHAWGVLKTGITFKIAEQNYSGLEVASNIPSNFAHQRFTAGADLGLLFQPIHMPILNYLSLRSLLPLQIGCTIRNVIRPQWAKYDEDLFPRSFRFGLSYAILLRDCIPGSWGTFRNGIKDWKILTAFDYHLLPGQRKGVYAGAELFIPVSRDIALYPRFGVNNQTERYALGVGLELPLTSGASLRVDYGYGAHPYMNGDNRFFLTLQSGKILRDADYLYRKHRDNISDIDILYNVLANYPSDTLHVDEVVEKLKAFDDPARRRRYLQFQGGSELALDIYEKDVKPSLYINDMETARKYGYKVMHELLKEESLPNSTLVILAEMQVLTKQVDDAAATLRLIEQNDAVTWKTEFLSGVVANLQGNYLESEKKFDESRKIVGKDSVQFNRHNGELLTNYILPSMELAICYIRQEEYGNACKWLKTIIDNMGTRLHRDYLRYPPYADNVINDDASYLLGLCNILDGNTHLGIGELKKTDLLYYAYEYGPIAAQKAKEFEALVAKDDLDGIKTLAQRLLTEFFEARVW